MSKHVYRFIAVPTVVPQFWEICGSEELHHLTKVLRLQTGQKIEVADGKGRWASAAIIQIAKDKVVVAVEDVKTSLESSEKLILCLGILRPGIFDDLLPSLVELGVDEIHLFQGQHGDSSRINDKVLLRWQRIMLTAFKQCKRSFMPRLSIEEDYQYMLEEMACRAVNRFVCEAGSAHSLIDVGMVQGSLCLLVGAESGLTTGEMEQAEKAAFRRVNLGGNILRAVTAAQTAVAICALRLSKNSADRTSSGA